MYRLFRPIYAPLVNRARQQMRQGRAIRQGTRRVQREIAAARADNRPLKVVIGAGGTRYEGWVHTDVPYLDATNPDDWKQFFRRGEISRIVAEHVFEHLTPAQLQAFLRSVRPYLTPDAIIRIAVPDGNHPNPAYIEHVRPGGAGTGAHDHKVLYTAASLQATIMEVSAHYLPTLLEYYDEAGNFHRHEWDPADGHINRTRASQSEHHRMLDYSSLIVDCIPVSGR